MRRRAAVLGLALLPVPLALPAAAAEPSRTAWYSAAGAGPVVLPAPGSGPEDLRVSGTGERPTAYAALALPGGTGGTLTLQVVDGTAVGTVEVAACPTRSSSWQAGPNQPFAAGPGYDCALGTAFGTLSADGSSVELLLDSSFVRAGALDVALVPLPESDVVFGVALTAPSFAPDTAPDPAPDPAPAGAPAEPAAAEPGGEPAAPDAGAAPAAGPLEPGALPAGAGADDGTGTDGGAGAAPLPELAAPATAPAAPADEPAPELPLALAPAPSAVPAAASAPAAQDGGRRLLALLALVAVSAGAGYAAGQSRTQPRLLGGRARSVPAAGAALALPDAPPSRAALPRGIGRFSRVRDAAPRRLR